jgi:hypothetical protein
MMTSLKGFMPVGLILSLIAADVRGDSNAALNAAASNLVYQAICQVVIADMLQRITPKVRNQLQAAHEITPPQKIDLNDLPDSRSDIPVIAGAIKGAPTSAPSEVSKKASEFITKAKPGEAAGNSNNGVKESDSGSDSLDAAKDAAQAQLEDMNPNEIAAIAEEAKNNLLKTMVDDNGDPVAEPKNPFQDQTKFDVCSKGATEHQESPPEEPPLLPPVPAPTPGNASGTAQGQKFPAKPVAPTPPAAPAPALPPAQPPKGGTGPSNPGGTPAPTSQPPAAPSGAPTASKAGDGAPPTDAPGPRVDPKGPRINPASANNSQSDKKALKRQIDKLKTLLEDLVRLATEGSLSEATVTGNNGRRNPTLRSKDYKRLLDLRKLLENLVNDLATLSRKLSDPNNRDVGGLTAATSSIEDKAKSAEQELNGLKKKSDDKAKKQN